ncbi:TIGR03769 domain-containing protein, partial [Bacillus sp. S34]|nr:TIGR03769 domain-containing protein [Bacillus sp. S34]
DTSVLFSPGDGDDRNDTATLPPDAHTHLSWAFTKPGVYTLHLRGALKKDDQSGSIDLGTTTVRFAVGPEAATNTSVGDDGSKSASPTPYPPP